MVASCVILFYCVILCYCVIFIQVEYLSLSRDTTETDIKQRRELVSGNAIYKDAAAVRAAMNGRLDRPITVRATLLTPHLGY